MAKIDPSIYERHLRENIAKWPVKVRHNGKPFDMAMESTEDISNLLDEGPIDDMTVNLMGVRSDFGQGGPRDLLEIKMRDGTWKEFLITNVPDRYDPVSPIITVTIGNPNKTR